MNYFVLLYCPFETVEPEDIISSPQSSDLDSDNHNKIAVFFLFIRLFAMLKSEIATVERV